MRDLFSFSMLAAFFIGVFCAIALVAIFATPESPKNKPLKSNAELYEECVDRAKYQDDDGRLLIACSSIRNCKNE